MKLVFSEQAWKIYLYGQQTDRKVLKRVNLLIQEIVRSPFQGIGKPEPLKHGLAGDWSRQINGKHRLVYKVEGGALLLDQCRYHY